MNYFMIYLSIFCLGVSAGLLLSHIVANKDLLPNRRRKKWKSQF